MHSDDENTIVADSEIITLSIGGSRTVSFQPKHSESSPSQNLLVSHNSLYVMTRKSQNWFRHGIPPPLPTEEVDERFSLTFRCLKKQFCRSVILIGDSNTKAVNFGSGFGKFGQSFPGKRVRAAKIKDIEPSDCTGFANVFLMCGTNDLRCENISHVSEIKNLVDVLKEKLILVKQLCPESKVFVVPVLPSKIPQMNKNICLFNSLVDKMLYSNFPDIWFEGIYSFVDRQGMLSDKLRRPNDDIHLGPRGIAKLVTYLKICIYKREQFEKYMKSHKNYKQESTQEVGPSGLT